MSKTGMKRGKIQAVYKYLPGSWIPYKDNNNQALNNRSISAKIENWNEKVIDLYSGIIDEEIQRNVLSFDKRGGDTSNFSFGNTNDKFEYIEVNKSEGFSEIKAKVSPLVFYCRKCNHAFELKNEREFNSNVWRCPKCHSYDVAQLQMGYSCTCGYSEPVTISGVAYGKKNIEYKPDVNSFKFFYKENGVQKPIEFVVKCKCGKMLFPKNATDAFHFKPFTTTVVNLVDDKQGLFLNIDKRSRHIIVAKWFDLITDEKYDYIVRNAENEFDDSLVNEANKKIEEELASFRNNGMDEGTLKMMERSLRSVSNTSEVSTICENVEKVLGFQLESERFNYLGLRLVEFDTLKRPKSKIELEAAIEFALKRKIILSEDEIREKITKMGIKNIQVTGESELFIGAYGYSRVQRDPSRVRDGRLKLMSFGKNSKSRYKVYSSMLNTEGILVEIDMKRIIVWLYKNNIISESSLPDIEDELTIKRWFVENIYPENISAFSTKEDFPENDITMWVYNLLHTIAHSLIISAGEYSGLEKNSLKEMILIETGSVFIYAQSTQGITLGSLSGLFEQKLNQFLDYALSETKECIFDPICTDQDYTSCSACVYLPDTSCEHFNNDLGRKYLFNLNIPGENELIGFWGMN